MKNSYKLTPLGAALVLATASSHANGLYVGADAGGAFQQKVSILDNTGFNSKGGEVKFDTGVRADGYMGYDFDQYFLPNWMSGLSITGSIPSAHSNFLLWAPARTSMKFLF